MCTCIHSRLLAREEKRLLKDTELVTEPANVHLDILKNQRLRILGLHKGDCVHVRTAKCTWWLRYVVRRVSSLTKVIFNVKYWTQMASILYLSDLLF